MDNLFAYVMMAAITMPLSFFLARGCLRGLVRIMSGTARRDVL